MLKKIIYGSLVVIVLLSGCNDDTDTKSDTQTGQTNQQTSDEETTNQAPTVSAGTDTTTIVNESVTITGNASDRDGTISNIEWKKSNEVLATTLSFSYTPTEVGTDVLTLVVMDDDGTISSDSVEITVQSTSNIRKEIK